MADLFLILFFISFICLIVGLINPSIFTRLIKKEITRKKIGLGFGVAILVFFVLVGITYEPKEKVAQPTQLQSEKEVAIGEMTEKATEDETEKEPDKQEKTGETIEKEVSEPEPEPEPVSEPEPETKTDRDKMIEIFKAEALAEWGDDYEMVKYEIDNQTEAYDWVVKQTKYPDIMTKAKQEWGDDYVMVKYEYENQVNAYEWISQQIAYPEIMARAKQKWGNDYVMVKYEYEKQVEAYESL